MKTPRDRVMAYLALGLITLTIGGLIYFLYYDRNMSALKKKQRAVESELATHEAALEQFEKAKPTLDAAKRLSLPPDINLNEYQNELIKMLEASRFPAQKITSVAPKQQVEIQKTTGPNRQKPMFTRV